MQEAQFQSLDLIDPPEKDMAGYCNIIDWEIP